MANMEIHEMAHFFRKCLPPAGNRIPFSSIVKMLSARGCVDEWMAGLFPSSRCFFLSSGTAALHVTLLSLKNHSHRNEVIIPAYTCPSLVTAITKAGLTAIACDLEESGFGMDLSQVESLMGDATLAVIAVHLFGLPEKVHELKRLTRQRKVFLIEDAAQAFGNRLASENLPPTEKAPAGTVGDIGVFSFGRGKPLSLMGGGAVLVSDPVIEKWVEEVYAVIPDDDSWVNATNYLLKVILYSFAFNPALYSLPRSLPWLKLGQTIFYEDCHIQRAGGLVMRLMEVLCESFQGLSESRRLAASRYREALAPFTDHIEFPYVPANSEPVLLRFPVLLKRKDVRDRVLSDLKAADTGASENYPLTINELPGACDHIANRQAHFPNATHVANRIITLPLHDYVTDDHIRLIAEIMENNVSF